MCIDDLTQHGDFRQMKATENSSALVEALETLFYADSDEKKILRNKLRSLLNGMQFKHAIDLGAGPGLVSKVLDEHSDKLTLVEITPQYESVLREKFPDAVVEIKSFLDVDFSTSYDLILLSHVLYYIETSLWYPTIKKLYDHVNEGGMLIICHAPCDSIHAIFAEKLAQQRNLAYMPSNEVDDVMNKVGPCTKDYYLSKSYYPGPLDDEFSEHFIKQFYYLYDSQPLENCEEELKQFTHLFESHGDQVSLEFHSDIYVFSKKGRSASTELNAP